MTPLSPSLGRLKLFLSPYLGRTVSLTYSFPGSNSSVRVRSSPIRRYRFRSTLSGSTMTSTTGSPSNSSRLRRDSFFFPSGLHVLVPTLVSTRSVSSCLGLAKVSNKASWLGSKDASFSLFLPKSCLFNQATCDRSSCTFCCSSPVCSISF